MSTSLNKNYTEAEEIDTRGIIRVLKNNLFLIIITTSLAIFVSFLYAYFSTDMYMSRSTLEIKENTKNTTQDFMANALGVGVNNVDNEIEMLKSQWIINQAIAQLNLKTRYFTKKNFKTIELYKNSPFVVTSEFVSEKVVSPFILTPYDEDHFILSIRPSLLNSLIFKLRSYLGQISEDERPIQYAQKHVYGENINTQYFHLTVHKVIEPEENEYSFVIQSNKETLKIISENLSVNTISKLGTIIELTYQDNNPQRGKEILNAITNSYIASDISEKTQSAKRTLNFLDKQIEAINLTLKGSSKTLETYKATHVIINLGAKAQITAQKLADLEQQLYEVNMQLEVLDNTLSFVNKNQLKDIDLASTNTMSPTISELIVKVQEAKTKRKLLLADYTELHPDVIKINDQLSSLKNTLKNTIKSSIRSLHERKITINKYMEENTASLESLPQQEQELARINRNFMVNEKIFSYLLQKRAETAIVESSTVSKVHIIDKAVLADLPFKPKRLLIVIIGAFSGLLLGIILALIRYSLKKTIDSIEDFERLSKLPIYGILPANERNNQLQAFTEALRVIRTNLEFTNSGETKLLTITSSVPSEGKTTVSSEVSKIIALSNKKVLLIDMDMRRGKIHKIFNINNDKGMSTILSGKSTLAETIIPTKVKNLYLITAGPLPPNPSELLMSKEFKRMTENLKSKFDYIIFDSPPIGLVTDAMMLMQQSDISLFVFKANFSKKDFISRINLLSEQHDISAGVILNGVKYGKKNKIGYGYGYGYGYNY